MHAPVSITATCTTVIIVFNSHFCMHAMQLRFTFCLSPISSCLAVRSLTAFITSVCKCVCACDKLHYVTYLDWRGCQQFGATYLDTIQRISCTYSYRYRSAMYFNFWHAHCKTKDVLLCAVNLIEEWCVSCLLPAILYPMEYTAKWITATDYSPVAHQGLVHHYKVQLLMCDQIS